MAFSRQRLARLHPVWLWFAICTCLVMISQITGAGMLDGGFGSGLFGFLFLIGAPFIIVARIGVAATAWGSTWLQAVVAVALVLAATALADRFVTRWLLRPVSNRKPLP